MTNRNDRLPTPDVQALIPSREFIARLKQPLTSWLSDYSDAEIKASLRVSTAAHMPARARLYADELARRNTLYSLERQYGYAALAVAAVAA